MIPTHIMLSWLEKARHHITDMARRRTLDQNPRRSSNAYLRQLCPHFGGDVVNVSGFMDEDKQNGHYKEYFPSADSYSITNYAGSGVIGDGAEGSIYLDLQADPDPDLKEKFDTALCHTVLEHIEFIQPAFANLSHITKETLILVVPFLQDEHYRPGIFGDYWRYTPQGLASLYQQHGFTMIHCSANDTPWYPVYLTAVGVRHPEAHPDIPAGNCGEDNRVGRKTYVYDNCVW